MVLRNSIVTYSVSGGNILKTVIPYEVHYTWKSFDNLKECIKKDSKIKYFDEDDEIISIVSSQDFNTFHQIVLLKVFSKNQVIVIAYHNEFDIRKFDTPAKLINYAESKEIKVESEDSVNKIMRMSYFDDCSSSGTSSSSSDVCKSKKNRSTKKYSAKIRKELNYLSGSEVSDGQAITKKWRIKNTGSKRWKSNSVKCVLLPSQFSDWVKCEDINVPPCYADQKVDIEMEIKFEGKWTYDQLSSSNCYQKVKLTWLLFMTNILNEPKTHYKDYILTKLNLDINVKNRTYESVYPETGFSNLKKQTSESSIEKIDQDFSIVDVSDEEDVKKIPGSKLLQEDEKETQKSHVIQKELSSEIDIELPDCPNGDDFQISDFHESNITISTLQSNDNKIKNDSLKSDDYCEEKSGKNLERKILNNQSDVEKFTVNSQEILFDEIKEIISLSEMINVENDETTNFVDKDKNVVHSNYDDNNVILVNKNSDDNDNRVNCSTVTVGSGIYDNINDKSPSNIEIVTDDNQRITVANICSDVAVAIVNDDCNDDGENNEYRTPLENSLEKSKIMNESEENTKNNDIDRLHNIGTQYENDHNDEKVINKENEQSTVTSEDSNEHPPVSSTDHPLEIDNEQNSANIYHNPIYNVPYNNGFIRPSSGWNTPSPYIPVAHQPLYNGTPSGITNYVPGVPYLINQNSYQYPIQNHSSDRIIKELANNGNIHNNINDAKLSEIIVPSNMDTETTTNMHRLNSMGFVDSNKNYRLLIKYNNDINNVLQDLLD